MQEMLNQLNDKQKQAVLCTEGPLLVLAGAGSGKTRVITYRIAYLIKEKKVSPWNILAITFTNKAAKEMRTRIEDLLGNAANDIWIKTFHSACVRILRRDIDKIGWDSNFVIYDYSDQQTIIKECIKQLNLNTQNFEPKGMLKQISNAKNELIDSKSFAMDSGNYRTKKVSEIYELYQTKLKANNALDFDDIIMKTVQLFRNNPDILNFYRNKFRYILVDEYQDTNTAQYVLVSLLAGKEANLCVVGDDDQSIYKFRGANIKNILDFEKEYKNAVSIKLEQNYRSTSNILSAANHVIKNNTGRKEKKLWTSNQKGACVEVLYGNNEHMEAQLIVRKIEAHMREGGKYSDVAILYRMNAQSRVVEDILKSSAIPYRILGGLRYYDRKEIKDIISYLRVIYNRSDSISLTRIINEPKRGIGKVTVDTALALAAQLGVSLFTVLEQSASLPQLARASDRLLDFTRMINKFSQERHSMLLTDLVSNIIDKTGYARYLESMSGIEGQSRMENLKEFVSIALEYQNGVHEGGLEIAQDDGFENAQDDSVEIIQNEAFEKAQGDDLKSVQQDGLTDTQDSGFADDRQDMLLGFLEQLSLVADVDNYDSQQDAVVLMTLHSAKGLEFPLVFMCGMEEGVFPSSHSSYVPEDLEEERRLCYVGITRARQKLYISHAFSRTIFGSTSYNRLSRFVDEIPPEFIITDEKPNRPSVKKKQTVAEPAIDITTAAKQAIDLTSLFTPTSASTASEDLKVGDVVLHNKFGKGVIIGLNALSGYTVYSVHFEKIGPKNISSKYGNTLSKI